MGMSDCGCSDCVPVHEHVETTGFLKDFAQTLWQLCNQSDYDGDVHKHLNIKNREDLSILSHRFSPLLAKQVQFYTAQTMLPKVVKLSSYSDGIAQAPIYVTFDDRNRNRVVSTDDTYMFMDKPFKHVALTSVGSSSILFQISFHQKDKKIAETYLDEVKKNVRRAELFKGAILEVLPGDRVDFIYDVEAPNLYLKQSVQEEIELNFDFMLKRKKDIIKQKIPWRRGLLFHGYPGTGKTQIAKYMAVRGASYGLTVLWVTSKAIHSTDEISSLFAFARDYTPCLLVFEDIDLFAGARDEYEGARDLLGEFLSQLDGMLKNDGLFVVATTNRLGVVDKALSDRPVRFDVKLELDYTDTESKISLIKLFNKSSLPIDVNRIAASIDMATPAHIQELLIKASLLSLQKNVQLDTEQILKIWNQMRPKNIGAEVT